MLNIIWEKILDFVLVLLIVASMFAILSATNDAISATEYVNEVEKIISESNISQNTIDYCINKATEDGYTLTVQVYSESLIDRYAEIKLDYKYSIPLLQVNSAHSKIKIVR